MKSKPIDDSGWTSRDAELSAGERAAPPAGSPLMAWGRRARLAAAALLALWSAHSLTRPFFWDHGIFAWIGDVVLGGGLPYRDAWDIKGPVTYLVAALAEWPFGRNEWGLRLVDLLIVCGGAAALGALAWRLARDRAAAWWSAALYLLWYASLDYANSAQADGWAAALLAAAMLVLVGDGDDAPRARGAAFCGALIGACVLVKPTYGAFLLAPAAYLWGAASRVSPARTLARLAALAVGAAVPVALCVLWFARAGALDSLVDVYMRYPLVVYAGGDSPWIWRLQGGAEWLLLRPFAIPLPFALVGAATLLRRRRDAALLSIAWALAAIANVLVQGRFYAYHWIPFYPPLALLTGVGVAAVYRAVAGTPGLDGAPAGRQLFVAAAAVLACSAAFVPLQTVYRWTKVVAHARARDAYEAREYGSDGRQAASMRTVAEYVRRRTGPDDRVLFWAQHPGYDYLIGRRPPGRFAFPLPLLQAPASAAGVAYRREFIASLATATPAYVVAPAARDCDAAAIDRQACVSSFPALADFLARHYRADTTFTVDADSVVLHVDVLRRSE